MNFAARHSLLNLGKRARKARFCCSVLAGVGMLLLLHVQVWAQFPGGRNPMQNFPGMMGDRGGARQGPFKDSLLHRTGLEDSATILFRYLDTARFQYPDSSVNDFTKRWPIPWTSIFLGNTGAASRSLLFAPLMKAGWDHGLHAYDAYMLSEADARFYTTSRPLPNSATCWVPGRNKILVCCIHKTSATTGTRRFATSCAMPPVFFATS